MHNTYRDGEQAPLPARLHKPQRAQCGRGGTRGGRSATDVHCEGFGTNELTNKRTNVADASVNQRT